LQEFKGRLLDALRIHGGKPYMGHNKNDVLLNRLGACSACGRPAKVGVVGGGQHRVTDMLPGRDQGWLRVGSGLAQGWLRVGSGLAQGWLRVGSGLVRVGSGLAQGWIRVGSGLGQGWSGLVRVGSGSGQGGLDR
jgi:hypothetical protein